MTSSSRLPCFSIIVMNYLRKCFVLCWNIRGLNAKTKQLALLNAIKLSGCDIVWLQETKKSHFDLAFIKS